MTTLSIADIKSPCTKDCYLINKITHMECVGCGRSQDQIKEWRDYTSQQKQSVLDSIQDRQSQEI